MNCEQVENLICAKLDGEASPADAAALQQHLASCPACAATAGAIARQDADLERAFAPMRQRAAVVAEVAIRSIHVPSPVARFRPWLIAMLSAAAGFAVAVLVFRPWQSRAPQGAIARNGSESRPQTAPTMKPAGQLALATGPIEILEPRQKDWTIMPTGGAIAPGSRLRTQQNFRCELDMADGSTVRLNGGTELAIDSPRKYQLAHGQMWSGVQHDSSPFQVAVADATVTALGTQFDILATGADATITCIQGSTRVDGGGGEAVVKSGQQLRIANGKLLNKEEVYDLLLATSWVNELLAMKGRDNQELSARVNDLLAQIGRTKMVELYEDEIRSLGDHCVLPLTRYIQSAQSRTEPQRRATAARILSDLAQPRSIGDLIGLLADSDADIRFQAARALHRLTGLDQGATPQDWRDDSPKTREALQKWRNWWAKSRDRYGAGPR